ncbi:cilia- and flagella-associated protein 36 isoform X2 [Phymastichus coffea]|uniref:cilia- and flagella-associated protein 36 isoform X2 n=1 Tax=Phymastichus coffea TaxID=108790 RepID=UPI00273CD235|nr:cilia- and flagella-associated protein 36 isoform X2 [Phymastichus coffea]
MAEKDDSAWVFDSLVGFLQGPIWSAPLLTFIEEKSLIFEPETYDSKEYREVYQEYKNLVDLLLGCYMEDMAISPEQFERACTLNKSTQVPVQFQQTLFEQIWAANEYQVFKRMMIQKNLELQLQALKMIEQKFGLTPASLSSQPEHFLDEELPMEQILQNENADGSDRAHDDEPTADLELDLDKDENEIRLEHERLTTKYKDESELLREALKKSSVNSPILEEDEQEQPALHQDPMGIHELDASANFSIKPKEEAKEEDVRKRQLYLKAQRDKLVALKKQARSQRLGGVSGASASSTRPSSAKIVAEASIDGKQQEFNAQPMDSSILQVRKALGRQTQGRSCIQVNCSLVCALHLHFHVYFIRLSPSFTITTRHLQIITRYRQFATNETS